MVEIQQQGACLFRLGCRPPAPCIEQEAFNQGGTNMLCIAAAAVLCLSCCNVHTAAALASTQHPGWGVAYHTLQVAKLHLKATTRVHWDLAVAGYMAKVPEEVMGNLQKTLNSAHSPVYSADFEQLYRQELRSTSSSRSNSNGNSRAGSRSGTTSNRPGTTSTKGGWLRDMFSSGALSSSSCSCTVLSWILVGCDYFHGIRDISWIAAA